ncbi:MAG: AAA family ATPase [Bacteroidetes bacterium]|nr:AAA family ATPase [Bacteroidota bacterium]
MLQSLHIRLYRQFKDFKLDNLKQVNLIVGKNTVGKSSLLETIRILLDTNKIEVLNDILILRDEHHGNPEQFIRSLLPAWIDMKGLLELLDISGNNKSNNFRTLAKYDSLEKRIFFNKENSDQDNPDYSRLNDFIRNRDIRRNRWSYDYTYRYMGIVSNTYNYYQNLWKDKRFSGDDKLAIELLQKILPELEEIDFTYTAVAKLKGINKQIPLGSLGEGFKRLFNLALEMVYARDNVLLIDEFEVGLHHSIQEQIWDATLMMAKELNVQLFVTTHSQDCIYGFARALNKRDDIDGQAIRLEAHEGKIHALAMDKELLFTIAETQTEVR